MAGYSTRQSSYTTGDTITAADTNDELDAIITAFGTSGHVHDGSSGNGGGLSNLKGSNTITIGAGTAGTDIAVTFDGETNDGLITWMEDEDYFKFGDDLMVIDNETLIFGSDSDWTIKYDESGDDDLVLTGSDMSIESSTSSKPIVSILNTNADANGGTLKFNKNGSSPATSDIIGNIDFVSEDAGNAVTTYARIQSTITDVTAGGEQGGMDFYVAEYDGTLTKGMALAGLGTDGNITVDISTHDGAAGGLKLGGTLVTSTATELNLLDGLTGLVSLSGSTNNTIATVTGANALAGESTFTYDGSDLAILEAVNDGNPSFTIGAASAESGKIQAVYDSGAQTLNYLEISTATADGGADAGFIRFDVDGTDIFDIDDGGVKFANGSAWEIGVAATTSTTAGRGLTIAAGATSTDGNDINGGDLTLSSGGGDGTGTSKIDFKTKASGTDVPSSKMQLTGAGDLSITGNLTVNGTTTTLDTATMNVVDPILTLQTASDGGALGSDTNKDVGIAMQYHTGSAAKSAFLGIDDSDSYKLIFIHDATISSEVVSGSAGTISANFEGGTVSGTTVTASTSLLPDASGGADIGSTSAEWGDVYIADDKFIQFGSDQNVLIGYDETTTDTLKIAATEGAALSITLMADEGDDAGDEWKLNVADGGTITLANDIASAGTHVTHLTITPNATVASSTMAFVGNITSKGNSVKTVGKESIWVPAVAMTPTSATPCADITTVDSGGNSGPDLRVLDFDKDSDEHAQFSICMPKQWDGGNVTFKAYWVGIAATTGVSWALQVKALNDNEDINVAYGTAVVVDDASQGSATELLISPESGDIACSGAADDLLFCQIFRDVSDSNDDMSGDARLVGVRILFTTDKANDS